MSYDLIVYARRDRLPSGDALSAALAKHDGPVEIPGRPTIIAVRGFLPVRHNGRDTGFEVLVSTITPEEISDYQEDLEVSGEEDTGYLKILTDNDTRITLQARDDASIEAAKVVATTLATLAGGVFSDPQEGS
jgi:hypothetical protein